MGSSHEEEEDGEESSCSSEDEQEAAPWFEAHRWLINGFIILIYAVVGVLVVHLLEGWGPITSLYVITQIVTTIGFGDFVLTSPTGQWFMIFYVIVGVMVVANILNDIFAISLESTSEAMRRRLRHLEAKMSSRIQDVEAARERCGTVNGLLVAIILYVAFVFGGASFYATYESCTCSYGASRVEGCIRERCVETGGKMKGWRESIYMAVITLSTTGFGDFSPKTKTGRVFGLFWMNLGVIAWVNLITQVSFWWAEIKKNRKRRLRLSMQDFDKIDQNSNGRLSRSEFRIFYLMQEGIVQPDDIKHIDRYFDLLDTGRTDYLTREEVSAAVSKGRLPARRRRAEE